MSPRIPALAVSSALAVALAALTPVHAGAAARDLRLPDLEQEPPSGLVVTGTLLGFTSATDNVGQGPVWLRASRKAMGDKAAVMTGALTWAGTFHGIGARLLREYAEQIGLSPAFTIHDREDSADLMNLVTIWGSP